MTLHVSAWPMRQNFDDNPYNSLLYAAMPRDVHVTEFNRRRFRVDNCDILHVHWPDMLLRSDRLWRVRYRFWRFLRAIDRLHHHGGKLVWTVHNLRPHQSRDPALAHACLEKFIARVDGLIFLSDSSRQQFLEIYPQARDIRYVVTPHLHYQSLYQPVSQHDARQSLGLSDQDTVLLMFGKIRNHKGLALLLDAHGKLARKDYKILLAGSPGKEGLPPEVEQTLTNDSNITCMLRHIEDNEISTIFSAADAVILPYENILNSGTAILALSLGKPIIAPELGSLPELRNQIGTDWVYLHDAPLSAAKLGAAMDWLRHGRHHEQAPDLTPLSAEVIAESTYRFYLSLRAGAGAARASL